MSAKIQDELELLQSKDHKLRFAGEYLLVKHKAEALDAIIDSYYEGNLGFAPDCPIAVLEAQSSAMWTYIKLLEYRADLEYVDLPRD